MLDTAGSVGGARVAEERNGRATPRPARILRILGREPIYFLNIDLFDLFGRTWS